MKSARIGLDLDGVIIDHTANKLRLARERGFELEPWQTNANLMGQFLPTEEYDEIKREAYAQLTASAEPVPGALEAIAELTGELFIVSARRADSVRHAQDWLDRHRLYDYIPAERIFFCADESEKKTHCHRLGLHFYLDDKIQVLNQLPFSVQRTLFDHHAVAERLSVPEEIRVAADWSGFLAQLSG